MDRLMYFYMELHDIETNTSVQATPQEVRKRAYKAVEKYFPYADLEFKERTYLRCLQGIAYNHERRLLKDCINKYSSLEFGGPICE